MDAKKLKRLRTEETSEEDLVKLIENLIDTNRELIAQNKLINQKLAKKNESSEQESSSDLIVLKWCTKNKIINVLNQNTDSLNGQTIEKENEEKMIEETKNLIEELINLPLKINYDLNEEIISNNFVAKSMIVLDIDRKTRLKIIDNLINNHNFTMLYGDLIKVETKKNLIDDNNQLINLLLNWKTRLIKIEKYDPLIVKKEKVVVDTDNSSNQTVNKAEMDDLKLKIDSLLGIINSRSNIDYTFELKNLKEFFESRKTCFSETFYCQNLPWRLRFEFFQKKDETSQLQNFLGFYLQCENLDESNWSVKCNYDLKILAQKADGNPKVANFTYEFTEREGYGRQNFILSDDLFDEKNAFVKNNTIVVQVSLKADYLIRC